MKCILKTNAIYILFLLLIILTSCMQIEKSAKQINKKEQNTNYSEVITFEHPQIKQRYKIVHVNPLLQQYIEKVKENPSHLTLELYKEEIIQPVYKDCFENG